MVRNKFLIGQLTNTDLTNRRLVEAGFFNEVEKDFYKSKEPQGLFIPIPERFDLGVNIDFEVFNFSWEEAKRRIGARVLEVVPLPRFYGVGTSKGNMILLVDEEGLLKDNPRVNVHANKWATGWPHPIVGNARGNYYSGGEDRYAYGGIVNEPTRFAYGGGIGLMGEAGAEAIMPLRRDKNGNLGVVAESSRQSPSFNVTMNVTTQDADSFRRSRHQIENDLRTVGRRLK